MLPCGGVGKKRREEAGSARPYRRPEAEGRSRGDPFNNPFRAAVEKLRRTEEAGSAGPYRRPEAEERSIGVPAKREAVKTASRPRAAPSRDESRAVAPASDDDLWRSAVAGTARLHDRPRRVAPPPPAPATLAVEDTEAAVLAVLSDLVAGEGSFDLRDTREYTEGAAPGVSQELLRRLRKGEFAVQSNLDLHGRTQKEARADLERFISGAWAKGERCVLVVHGRGLHSTDALPVLKQKVPDWLARGRLRKHVLAFASARPPDGGTGALYVLLRK
jgi:DNA-nicking Smr family endonuclease